MSDQQYTPSREEIRSARHTGFDDSVDHMAEDRRNRLTTSQRTQDARRENNIAGFYSTVLGGE